VVKRIRRQRKLAGGVPETPVTGSGGKSVIGRVGPACPDEGAGAE
jgi:hypothetical protein